MFKKEREKALELLAKQKEEENVPDLDDTPKEETVEDETAVEATPIEGAEEVPDENEENLTEPEAEAEEETTPQSAEPTAPLTQGSQSESDIDIEGVMAENKAMKEEIDSLRKALEQAGDLAKESTLAVATGDLANVDFSAFMYGDDEAKKGAAGKLVGYLIDALRNESVPILKERDEAKRALEVQKAIKTLSAMEDMFPGFSEEADAIEALIGRDKVLSAYENPTHQRITAYLINKGLKAVEKDKAGMSLDELMDLYRNNEEFKAAIEQDRLKRLEETGDVPVIPMDGGGLSSAVPYEAPEGPKTLEEAHKLVKKLYKRG